MSVGVGVGVVFLFTFLFSLPLSFSSTPANHPLNYLNTYCSNSSFNTSSKFRSNLDTLLNRSPYDEKHFSLFSMATEGEGSDQVYGLFLCRPDISEDLCRSCIGNASARIVQDCQSRKEAIIWYNECFVRYANRSFFSKLEMEPAFSSFSKGNLSDPDEFGRRLDEMFSNLTATATSSVDMFASGQVQVSNFVTLYGIVQCTRDLRMSYCRQCLDKAVGMIGDPMEDRAGGRCYMPCCYIRYEIYPIAVVEDPKAENEPSGKVVVRRQLS